MVAAKFLEMVTAIGQLCTREKGGGRHLRIQREQTHYHHLNGLARFWPVEYIMGIIYTVPVDNAGGSGLIHQTLFQLLQSPRGLHPPRCQFVSKKTAIL